MPCAAAVALALGDARPAGAQPHDTLVVATYAYPAVDRAGAIAPLAEHLRARLRRPTRVLVVADPVALAAAVREARADVAVTNTFGYLLLADGSPAAGEAVATFRVPPGVRTNYGAALVARDAGLSLAALGARIPTLRVGLVSEGSTTGSLVPRLALANHGVTDLERQARSVVYAGTHAGAFALLRDGTVDVAGLASAELERQRAALPAADRARYRVVWQSPDIQLGPVAVRASLPAGERAAIRDAVVGLEQRAPAAFRALRGGWTEAGRADALVAATDATYDPVRRLFGQGDAVVTLIRRFTREAPPAPRAP